MRLDVVPVPASRVRVPKFGKPYYGKNYTRFRALMEEELSGWEDDPVMGPLRVDVTFHCRYPKTVKRAWPRGDIDNFLKALFDSFNGKVWGDDDQVITVRATKVYDIEPRIEVRVFKCGEDT